MLDMHYHVTPPAGVARIVAHSDLGPAYAPRTEVIYPPESLEVSKGELPPHYTGHYPLTIPREHEFVYWTESLVFIERNVARLVIEPDSANWMILSRQGAALFEAMRKPVPYGYMLYNPYLTREESRSFLLECLSHNFIQAENYLTIFDPFEATPLPYADHFVLEVSTTSDPGEPDSIVRMSEDIALQVIPLVFKGRADDIFWIEMSSVDPAGDTKLISRLVKQVEAGQVKSFRNIKLLLHCPADKIEPAIASFLEWSGIIVRAYVDDADSLCSQGSALQGIRELIERDLLEGVSLEVNSPGDFSHVESLVLNEPIKALWLNFALLADDKRIPGSAVEDFTPIVAGLCCDMMENIIRAGPSAGAVPGIYPLSTLLAHLVTTGRSLPCSKKQYSGRRIYLDSQGRVSPCRGNCREDSCGACQWRNFCAGPCPGLTGATGLSGELYCSLMKALIPTLMWKVDENRDVLKLIGHRWGSPLWLPGKM